VQLSALCELLRTLVLCSAPVNKSAKSAADACSRVCVFMCMWIHISLDMCVCVCVCVCVCDREEK